MRYSFALIALRKAGVSVIDRNAKRLEVSVGGSGSVIEVDSKGDVCPQRVNFWIGCGERHREKLEKSGGNLREFR